MTLPPSHADIKRRARLQRELNNNLFTGSYSKLQSVTLALCRASRMQNLISNIWSALGINSISKLFFAYTDEIYCRPDLRSSYKKYQYHYISSGSSLWQISKWVCRFCAFLHVCVLRTYCICVWVCMCVCVAACGRVISSSFKSCHRPDAPLSGEAFICWLQMCLSSSPIIQREIGIVTLRELIQDKIEKWREGYTVIYGHAPLAWSHTHLLAHIDLKSHGRPTSISWW